MAAPALPAGSKKATTKKGLHPKNYVLLALMTTLTAAVVITAVFVVLSPARIYFSVTDARSHHPPPGGSGGIQLNLTINAVNSSPRTRVEYDSLFVDVTNSSSPAPMLLSFARATTTLTLLQLRQPAHSMSIINASVSLAQGEWVDAIPGNATSTPFAVVITALVRFRLRRFAKTRLYDIKVTCTPVIFVPDASNDTHPRAAKQTSATAPAAPPALPVSCG